MGDEPNDQLAVVSDGEFEALVRTGDYRQSSQEWSSVEVTGGVGIFLRFIVSCRASQYLLDTDSQIVWFGNERCYWFEPIMFSVRYTYTPSS